jgi:heat shock protein HtpX
LNQGLLDILDKNELEGVIAHELGHIRNRDILVMTFVSVLSGLITFITDFGFRTMLWGGGNSDGDDNNSSPLVLILWIVLMVLAPFISMLIGMAVSRQREYLADATSAPKGAN